MKIHPVGVELFHADGRKDRQTDRHDEANTRVGTLIVATIYLQLI